MTPPLVKTMSLEPLMLLASTTAAFTVLCLLVFSGASLANKSAFIVPMLVSIVAVYFLAGSIDISGGDENCLGAAVTGAP